MSVDARIVEFTGDVAATERLRIAGVLASLDLPVLRDGARVDVLAGGASNANYVLTAATGERMVLRVAKSAVERFGIDRWRGADAQRAAASVGVAPALLAAALPAGHAVSPFVEGPLLDAAGIREPAHAPAASRRRCARSTPPRRSTARSRSSPTSAATPPPPPPRACGCRGTSRS